MPSYRAEEDTMNGIWSVDDASFAEIVEQAEGLVLVDFAAAWCAPCRIMTPVLEQVAAEYGSRVKVVTLDVDTSPVTAVRFGVRSLPTLVFLRDGVEVDRSVGAVPKAALQARLDTHLAVPAA